MKTESQLHDVFKQAREKSPCIVVLDELDALVRRREEGTGGEVEKRVVVVTLLTVLDSMGDGTTDRHDRVEPQIVQTSLILHCVVQAGFIEGLGLIVVKL